VPEVLLFKYRGPEGWTKWQSAFASTTKALGFQEIIFTIPAIKKSVKAEPDHEGLAFRELDEDNVFPVRTPAQKPRGWRDDDEAKEAYVDWLTSEAEAQEQLEEIRMLWLNMRRNRDLDRIEPARRGVPAGDNAVKIEDGLEFPVQQPENDEFELTGQTGVIKLDKNELKLFGPNTTFTNANTGKVDTSVQVIAREDIWAWCKASMAGGPMEYLIKKCAVHGDVRWIYESLKATATTPNIMSHAKLIGSFFNTRRDGGNLNAAKINMDEEADHIELISRNHKIGCFDFTIPAPLGRQILVDIALSHDPYGSRRTAIEKIIARGNQFTSDDMLKEIRQEEILRLEMVESEKRYSQRAGVRAEEAIAQLNAVSLGARSGACYNYNSDAGCRRSNCIFDHRKLTDEELAKKAEEL